MSAVAVSIHDRGPHIWRPIELRDFWTLLPGADSLAWRIEVNDLLGGTVANEIADEVERRRGGDPLVLDGMAMRKFADDISQLYGGQFVGYQKSATRVAIDAALGSRSAFESSAIRYVLLDITGEEWVVIARDSGDVSDLRSQLRDVRDADLDAEFPVTW
jgi:hypothetical protein